MTVGMINANPVVHERPERASHPHAADVLDPLDVFGRVLQSSPRESISFGSFSSAFA
jgi:hypothetical protein